MGDLHYKQQAEAKGELQELAELTHEGLNSRQILLVKNFVLNPQTKGNLTQSAIASGYEPRSAYAQGSRNFKNPKVLAFKKEVELYAWEVNRHSKVQQIATYMKDARDAKAKGDMTSYFKAMDKIDQLEGYKPADVTHVKSLNVHAVNDTKKLYNEAMEEVKELSGRF